MSKFCGVIGYGKQVESKPGSGVWKEIITEKTYYGDVIRNSTNVQSAEQVNDNIIVANQISIVSDPFANANIYAIRYVHFMGANWKVSKVDVLYPRLLLTIGGVYNSKQNQSTSSTITS